MSFDFENLRDILVCPACRCEMVHDGDALVSTGADCRMSFPITDEIPRLLVDDATVLSPEEWAEVMGRHGRDDASAPAS